MNPFILLSYGLNSKADWALQLLVVNQIKRNTISICFVMIPTDGKGFGNKP